MKEIKKLPLPLIAICIILLSFIGCTVTNFFITSGDDETATPAETSAVAYTPGTATPDPDIEEKPEFRALWVATVLNLDFPSKPGISAAAMKREIDAIIATTADIGLNAVIFQVRPTGDAFYRSDIFPWSQWLSGEQGTGIKDFDPLAYWIEACHANNIELHAWLNPYRIIHTSSDSSDADTLSDTNPVRLNPDLAVAWANSGGNRGLFLDPGLPEARQLIIDGIVELISGYDVDGIHFDDYFYPGTDFNDSSSYDRYGDFYGEDLSLEDWRRENVNTLIKDIKSAIEQHNSQYNKNVRWGISPTAIWKNGSSDPLGIPTTAGQESYHALYADTRRWVMEGWVDYICPQIYWYIGYEIADFSAIFNWWSELCDQSPFDVDLYIGHAAYREHEDNQPPFWQGEMLRQLEMVSASDTARGSIFYRYFSLRDFVGRSIRDFYAEKDGRPIREPLMTLDTLSVGHPADDITIKGTPATVASHNIIGTSIPGIPLYLNGEEIMNRTVEGLFHVFVTLQQDENIFIFTQEGPDGEVSVTRTITLTAPDNVVSTPVPEPKITTVAAREYITVTAEDAWVYRSNNSSSNLSYMLIPGQRDRVLARSDNGFVKLSCGIWVRSDSVTSTAAGNITNNPLKDGSYSIDKDFDIIRWPAADSPAVTAFFAGDILTVNFGLHTDLPPLELPDFDTEDTIVKTARSGIRDGTPYYEFEIKEDVLFEGYYFIYNDESNIGNTSGGSSGTGELCLYLKKRKTIADSPMPLTNISIVLDAGHGGSLPGAIGPMGYDVPEKYLNLINTQKLAERLGNLGANVILTRDSDIDITLQERVDISNQIKPDLFISLHVNSIAETTNGGNIRGFTVWYHSANSAAFANAALDVMHYINPGTNRQRVIQQSNFFVCRPWWAPHVLFEASFISNIDDFIWLLDERRQDSMADAAVDAILDYFS